MRSTQEGQNTFETMIVTRGHGRGHAIPDIAISTKLRALVPDLRLKFVSYSTGAQTFRACGYDVVDLGLPENPPIWDAVIAATRLLTNAKVNLVVAHEEIAVLPIAHSLKIPCLFITDFFLDPHTVPMEALKYADEIIFTAPSGLFTEPPSLAGKVHYVGRAVREFGYGIDDRERARRELDIRADATVVLCQPGAWLESQVPLAELLKSAWNLLPPPKHLRWLAGQDFDRLLALFEGAKDVEIVKEDWRIDRLMSASNVLITKANRMSVYEAAAMGLPSISISNSANWPDDVAVAKVESNTPLWLGSVTADSLAKIIAEKAGTSPPAATELSGGAAKAAARIAHHIGLLRAAKSSFVS